MQTPTLAILVEREDSSRSTTAGETCWPNMLVTRSRAAVAATDFANWRRKLLATMPATMPVPSRMTLRLIWKTKECSGAPVNLSSGISQITSRNCSTAATAPVHTESQKSSRSVDSRMNTK